MKIEELLSDGTEHFSRTIKLFFLRKKSKREASQIKRLHFLIGKKAIEHKLPECLSTESGTRIKEIEKQIVAVQAQGWTEQQEIQNKMVAEKLEREATLLDTVSIDKKVGEIRDKQQLLKDELRKLESSRDKTGVLDDKDETSRLINKKMKELENLDSQISGYQNQIINEQREQHLFLTKLDLVEKKKKRIERETEKKFQPLKKQKNKLFSSLGKELLKDRLPDHELAHLYSRYDLASTSLESIKNAIQSENTLRTMINPKNILLFYICCSSALSIAVIVVLILFQLFAAQL